MQEGLTTSENIRNCKPYKHIETIYAGIEGQYARETIGEAAFLVLYFTSWLTD